MAGLNWETLLFLGDSITIGSRSYLGYPEYCGDFLSIALKKQWNIINHATAGFTTADLLRSLNANWLHYKEMFPGLITVMIGTNDVKNKSRPQLVKIAYEQLIVKTRLMSTGNNVILLKIPPLAPSVLYPYRYDMNTPLEEHNSMIDAIAKENGLRTFEFQSEATDFFDGVHLTDAGSAKFGKQLADLILRDKGIENPANQ